MEKESKKIAKQLDQELSKEQKERLEIKTRNFSERREAQEKERKKRNYLIGIILDQKFKKENKEENEQEKEFEKYMKKVKRQADMYEKQQEERKINQIKRQNKLKQLKVSGTGDVFKRFSEEYNKQKSSENEISDEER